jgi:transcriptional regulator with XRE-family HTH domain
VPRKPKAENDLLAKEIGERIKFAIDRQGLTVTDLHKRTAISRTVLLAYVRGNYAPGARELKLICECLEVTPTFVLFGTEDLKQTPFRIGDLALSSSMALGLSLTYFSMLLKQNEKEAVVTLIESILMARDPVGHAETQAIIRTALQDQVGQDFMGEVTKGIDESMQKHAEKMSQAVAERINAKAK